MSSFRRSHPHIVKTSFDSTISRRQLLGRGLLFAGATLPLPFLSACNGNSSGGTVGSVTPSGGSIPPLLDNPDANGLFLPRNFSSRVIAKAGLPIGGTTFLAPPVFFPDGAHSFQDPEVPGGWIHVINSEVPGAGGTIAIRFARDGTITDAYRTLGNTSTNCAGGATPWGTWISCEEIDDGTSWETHPLGQGVIDGVEYPIRLDSLGIYKHEAAAIDPANKIVYLTEDQSDGCFYRFVGTDPYAWDGSVRGDLSQGTLQVAVVSADGQNLKNTADFNSSQTHLVTWVDVPFPQGGSADPTRGQVYDATIFDGGEGCWFHNGLVYFTTKGDNRVWEYRVSDNRLSVLYDDDNFSTPTLTGVDNIIVESQHNHILVAEDGGNLEAIVITPDFEIAPLVRMDNAQHVGSEVTGIGFNPDRTRFYLNSQRGGMLGLPLPGAPGSGGGMVFEIRRDDGRPIFGD